METQPICPGCRKTLPPGTPFGLCPECLIKSGFQTGTEPAQAGKGSGFVPPAVEELRQLFPQLEIIELIGRGGMGAVYKARQPTLDRFVALKILPPGAAGDAGFAERFNREARALARLSHPHIVAVHDFGQAGGQPYLVMEFVDGANLRQVEQAGRLAPEQALQIVPQICEALQFAHNEGIVHRDIKPENILMDKKGRVKITDFGIAKILAPIGRAGSPLPAEATQTKGGAHGVTRPAHALTGAKDVVGTPHYMAPEQVEKPSTVDHRADIYSLGVVFYEMLTGELPLGKFAPPSKKVHVDVRLDEVVLRTLEKEPELRYQQASEVKTQVETIATTPSASSSRRESAPFAGEHGLSPAAATQYNPWELAITVGGTIFLLSGLFLAAPNLRGPVAAFVILMCVLGLLASALTFAGLWPFPSPFFPEPNFSSRNLRRRKLADPPRVTEPHLSRTAIVGAVWAILFFVGMALLAALTTWHRVPYPQPVFSARFLLLLSPLWLLALAAPFGTTILGWTAVSQIRRSAGRLYGLGLAVFDGLLFPLLLLSGLIYWILGTSLGFLAKQWVYSHGTHDTIWNDLGPWCIALLLIAVIAAVNFWIIRWVWRAVNKPIAGFSAPPSVSPTTPPAVGPARTGWGWVAATVTLHAIALLAGTAFFLFVVPRFLREYADWGAPLSAATFFTLRLGVFVGRGGYLLVPVLLILDLAVCLLLLKYAGRKLLGLWGALAFLAIIILVAVGMGTLFLPQLRILRSVGQQESGPQEATGRSASLATSPQRLRRLPTPEVIQAGLAKPDSPWAWQELEQRAKAGRLSATDVGALMDQLTAWVRRSYPEGYDQPVHWLNGLLNEMGKRRLVTDERMLAFLEAFYGKPTCEPLLRARENGQPRTLSLTCRWRSPWHTELFGLKLLNEMRSIAIDGKEAAWRNLHPNCEQYEFYGNLELPVLAPGKHVVKFVVESALIPKEDLVGLAPDTLAEDWPAAKRRWTRLCESELIVHPNDAEIVRLTEDPALDPVASGALSVKQVIIRSDSKHSASAVAVVVMEKDNTGQKLLVPISFDVTLRVGGENYPCGHVWSEAKGTRSGFTPNSGSRSELGADISPLNPEVQEAEVVLTPNPDAVEKEGAIDRIWGREIVFPHVRLVRQDLRQGEQPYFGPVIERVLTNDWAMDFDSSKQVGFPEFKTTGQGFDGIAEGMAAVATWIEQQGMDAFYTTGDFTAYGMKVKALREEDWSEMSPSELMDAIRSIDPKAPPQVLLDSGVAPYAFQTREGARGILQVLVTDNPPSVKIRYKLVPKAPL